MENPRQFYTPEYETILRTKVASIKCPILIIQGDVDRREPAINKFNAEVLIPELHALGKIVEVLTYPGEPHCFCFYGSGPRTPHPAAALKAYQDRRRLFQTLCGDKAEVARLGELVKYVPV